MNPLLALLAAMDSFRHSPWLLIHRLGNSNRHCWHATLWPPFVRSQPGVSLRRCPGKMSVYYQNSQQCARTFMIWHSCSSACVCRRVACHALPPCLSTTRTPNSFQPSLCCFSCCIGREHSHLHHLCLCPRLLALLQLLALPLIHLASRFDLFVWGHDAINSA